MSTVLWTLGALAVCAVLLYVASRIEPHWVAKDGQRFLTTFEMIDRWGQVVSRRREVRGVVLADGGVMLTRRALARSKSAVWRIEAKSPNPPVGRHVYILRSVPPDPEGERLLLRVPSKSALVAVLDERTPAGGGPGPVSAPTPGRGTRRWARRAGRG